MAEHNAVDGVELADRILRIRTLEEKMDAVDTKLAGLETVNGTLVQGVANFRGFQLDMKGKVGFMYGVAWIFGVLNTVALVVLGIVLTRMAPVIEQAIGDYYAHHPGAMLENKSVSHPPEWIYHVSSNAPPQDAGIRSESK